MTNMLLSPLTRTLTILFYYCSLLHDKYVIDSADKAPNNIVLLLLLSFVTNMLLTADKASNNIDLLLLLSFVTNMLLSLRTRSLNNIVLLLLKTNPQNVY